MSRVLVVAASAVLVASLVSPLAQGVEEPVARAAVSCVNPGDVQAAIGAAAPGDTITIAAGTCFENLFIDKSVNLVGAGATSTVLDGGGVDTVVSVVAPATVNITGLSIRNGLGAGPIGGGLDMAGGIVTLTDAEVAFNAGGTGAGIANYGGFLTLLRTSVANNESSGPGGGIFTTGGLSTSSLTIDGGTIEFNTAGAGTTGPTDGTSGGDGGGIYNGGSTVVIMDSVIANNQAGNGGDGRDGAPAQKGGNGGRGGHGGGVFNAAVASLTLIRTDVSNNLAGTGGAGGEGGNGTGNGGDGGNGGASGGVFNVVGTATEAGGTIHLSDGSVIGNESGGGGAGGAGGVGGLIGGDGGAGGIGGPGGGLANGLTEPADVASTAPFGAMTVERAAIVANTAGPKGIGGDSLGGGTVGTDGLAGWGGGVFNHDNGELKLSNVTVSGNVSDNGGGGVDNQGRAFIEHSTMVNNVGTIGGLATFGTVPPSLPSLVTLDSTILILNRLGDTTPSDCGGGGAVLSSGYNLLGLGVDTDCGFAPHVSDLFEGTGYVLPPLSNSGGPWTHGLSASDPAVDAVPLAACSLGVDARRVARPQGPACDIGAFEREQGGTIEIVKDAVPNGPQDFAFDWQLPPLHVEGRWIVDDSGRAVVLRGIAPPDPLEMASGDSPWLGPWQPELFDAMASWGATVVRLAVHPPQWRSAPVADQLAVLDEAVGWAADRGMYVMLDYHGMGFPPTGYNFDPFYETTAAQMIEFWDIASAHFAGNDAVAFYELLNEPTTGPGGAAGLATWQQWQQFTEDVIDVIRTNDPETVVVVGGLDWANDLSFVPTAPVNRTNVAYASHPYPVKWSALPWDDAFGTTAETYPVLITEWAYDNCADPGSNFVWESEYTGPGRYRDSLVDYMDSHGIGWVGWSFSHVWTPRMVVDSVDYWPPSTDPGPGAYEGGLCPPPESITGPGDFFFDTLTAARSGVQPFSLDDDTDPVLDNTATFTGLPPGPYTFTETAVAGWDLSGLVCVDPDDGTTVDVAAATATIDLDDGETVTCTFTNRRLPTADPDSYTTPYETLLDAASVLDNDTDPAGEVMFAIKDSDPAVGQLDWFTNGTFRYTPPAGFSGDVTFEYHVDVDGVTSAPALVTITVGEAPQSTGTIEIIKDAIPDSSVMAFDFVGSMGPFSLADHGGGGFDHVITFTGLAPGPYTFTETAVAGWDLTDMLCVDPDDGTTVDIAAATASVDLGGGETVTCTFTNRQLPTAEPNSYTTPYQTLLEAASVLDNDTDPVGEVMFAIKDSDPAVGQLDWLTNGTFRYTPPAGFSGDVTFEYHIEVGPVNSAPALVTITVGEAPGPSGGTVTGVVYLDGLALGGVEVWLLQGGVSRYECTDGNGAFTFSGVTAGTPLFSATGPSVAAGCDNADFVDPANGFPLRTQFYDHRHVFGLADAFTVADGETRTIRFDAYYKGDNLGMVDPATGQWHLRRPGGGIEAFYFGNPGDVPFVGDWDCDGVATPGLFRLSDAFAYLRNSNDQGIADIKFFFGDPNDIPLAGDFNGDGCDTLSLYRPTEQRFYIMNALGENNGGLGAAEYTFDFGNPGDTPFVGDFDGDGLDEVGLHRSTTGLVYFEDELIRNGGGGAADHEFIFGDPGDRFVAGDWAASGFDAPGLFRPIDETWYLKFQNTQGNADASIQLGEAPWLPVAGFWGLGRAAAP